MVGYRGLILFVSQDRVVRVVDDASSPDGASSDQAIDLVEVRVLTAANWSTALVFRPGFLFMAPIVDLQVTLTLFPVGMVDAALNPTHLFFHPADISLQLLHALIEVDETLLLEMGPLLEVFLFGG